MFISETESAALITPELAYQAVHDALIAATGEDSRVFPAIIAQRSPMDNRFSVKAAMTPQISGAKMGFYWLTNKAIGLPAHNSVIILIDQMLGKVGAVIEAGEVNCYRTAAADAVAVAALARTGAKVLTVFGAGHQAEYEIQAIRKVRSIEQVLIVNRSAHAAITLVKTLRAQGIHAEAVDAQTGCAAADIITTVTPSRAPLFKAEWIKPGTHISAMGADAEGKQELPPALLANARLFCDLPSQSIRIGEYQHLAASASASASSCVVNTSPIAIGEVLSGRVGGRPQGKEGDALTTIFDSSGIAIQDLYVGEAILEKFKEKQSYL